MIAPNRSDRVYDTETHGGNVGPRCFCGQHAEVNRRYRCDIEAVRAWHMDDPIFCHTCSTVFERGSVASPETLGESLVGCCGRCQAARPRPVKAKRYGLSAARAQKVALSDPWRRLSSYSPADLFYEAFDEVPDARV